jgi:hypothetical protein
VISNLNNFHNSTIKKIFGSTCSEHTKYTLSLTFFVSRKWYSQSRIYIWQLFGNQSQTCTDWTHNTYEQCQTRIFEQKKKLVGRIPPHYMFQKKKTYAKVWEEKLNAVAFVVRKEFFILSVIEFRLKKKTDIWRWENRKSFGFSFLFYFGDFFHSRCGISDLFHLHCSACEQKNWRHLSDVKHSKTGRALFRYR